MNEISYISAAVLRVIAEDPSRAITALEYACIATLLIAVFSDSFLRNRRPAGQKSAVEDRSRTGRQ